MTTHVPQPSPRSADADSGPGARRMLFVSSVVAGGSGRSQRELAAELNARGRSVRFLVDAGEARQRRRRLLSRVTDATVRFERTPVGPAFDVVRGRLGARAATREIDGLHHYVTIAPENGFERSIRLWRPDVVVASSISRVTWRRIRAMCRSHAIPVALHLREVAALGHLTAGLVPDVLLANSGALVDDAARLGFDAEFVPSVVRIEPMDRPPTREVVLLVNPQASHGLHIVGPLAAARPDIPIVLQESWVLDGHRLAEVERLARDHRNVFFRELEPEPRTIFRDAGILLAPHQVDNRPRTVLEAQSNGIPVVASDQPGLVEAVGRGGVLVPADAGTEQWVRSISEIWDDESRWMNLSDQARMHAGRAEIRTPAIAERFLELMDGIAGRS